MICKNTIHSINCPSYKNNSLKGTSVVVSNNNYNNKNNLRKYIFDINEVSILSIVLEISKLYITKNSSLFQSNDILKEVNESLKILKPGMNQLKGASSICPKQVLMNIRNMFGLN